ncbi:MAG TPA: NAD-dependent epimerase/dehydratase family protein [Bacteroidota bacterium]|nr:NAD-dependent epimerase/dehydratase family protein [Bacteroidota bacterium]
MDIQGKTVLVIGGWGLVGSAICRRFMDERPKRMVVTSLTRREAEEAVARLRQDFPGVGPKFFIPWWGNIFVRHQLKDMPREAVLANARHRLMVIEDIVEELSGTVLKRSSLYRLMQQYRPDVVVDCVNSATGIAYQDIFQASRQLLREVRQARSARKPASPELLDGVERLLCTLYVPQLIRHVQIMYRSMQEAGTGIYVKIGTSGTGGMGLNIPYTHSEERPSRVLLSKSAVAGAHTLLLFLMGRTPDAPITKEIKPTAAIAWKNIAYGEITRRGRPIALVDCPPSAAVRIGPTLRLAMPGTGAPTGQTLKSVFIDTGENGLFSRGEFEAISTPGQMEFVTPEEIAESTIFEIRAGNTGHDIINALDNATLAPTYRAGFMFNGAMDSLRNLEREHGVDSVAFEMLGPPRLSKLLYESYLLKLCYGDIRSVARSDPRTMSRRLTDLVAIDAQLRSQIISIGIPILMPDGKSMLRGAAIKIPPHRGEDTLPVSPRAIDGWAHDGWVDLREKNMSVWQTRMADICRMVDALPAEETSSRTMHNRDYWNNLAEIDPGKICGWIFTYEEKGKRMKA